MNKIYDNQGNLVGHTDGLSTGQIINGVITIAAGLSALAHDQAVENEVQRIKNKARNSGLPEPIFKMPVSHWNKFLIGFTITLPVFALMVLIAVTSDDSIDSNLALVLWGVAIVSIAWIIGACKVVFSTSNITYYIPDETYPRSVN